MHEYSSRSAPPPRRKLLGLAGAASIATLAGLVFAGPAYAATNLVADGDFSSPAQASGYSTYCAASATVCTSVNPTFGAWTVTTGSIDLYSNAFAAPPPGDPASTQTVDLDGSEPGGITQVVNLGVGTYQLSFEVGQNIAGCDDAATKSVTYGLGANPAGTFTYDPAVDTGWQQVSIPVSVGTAGGYNVSFTSADPAGDVCGPLIADVSLTSIPNAGTPMADPAIAVGGIGVLGAIAGGFVLFRRRRASAAA